VFDDGAEEKVWTSVRERDSCTGEKSCTEKLYNMYLSPNVIRTDNSRIMRWSEYTSRSGKVGNAYTILVGKSNRKISLERPWRRWEDMVKMDLKQSLRSWTEIILMRELRFSRR
jgi:hypothetical protein